MSIRLCNLLDREKYFFAELVYVHPPGGLRYVLSPDAPLPLADFLAEMRRLAASGEYAHMRTAAYQKRLEALLATCRNSENLRGATLSGYINDNFGALGNTGNRWKTSLVAMAFRDGEGNALVSVSGCEMSQWHSAALDWSGCALAMAGVVTPHHRRALRFFDAQTRGLPGEKGVVGHSKGGNIATYIFISRLHEQVNAYCINAQPYCWRAMSHEQRAALKSDRYEYIVHTKDFARRFGYVSYISRTVPLSRYVRAGGLTSHGFAAVRFDEVGNLEGDRVIRRTKGRLQSIVFRDDVAEKRLSHDESLALFRAQMKAITQVPRLLSVGLEEIMLTLGAQAATLWLCDADDAGMYIYPYIVKGPASEALYRLKLRPGGGIAARSAFDGQPFLTGEAADDPNFMPGVDRSTGFHTRTMLTVPLGAGGKPLGALQILNKAGGAFDERDLRLAADMADCVSEVFSQKGGGAVGVREFHLLRIYGGGGEELFAIEQNECRVLSASSPADARRLLGLLLGQAIAPGGWLVFNRRVFDRSMTDALRRMRAGDISTLSLPGRGDLTAAQALAALDDAMRKRPMLVLADLSGGTADSDGGLALTAALRKLCADRTTTVVIVE